jgi:electron transfer flavoprotein alpha/beta subunit
MMAKKKVIETIKPEELGFNEGDSERIILQAQNSPPEKEPGQIFEGVGEIPTIISKLRNEANVI